MYGQIGVVGNVNQAPGFLYDIPFNDKHHRHSRWLIHPNQCLEKCRTVDGAAYAIARTGHGDPACACASQVFTKYLPAKGWNANGENIVKQRSVSSNVYHNKIV
jgi:hypothetical protein